MLVSVDGVGFAPIGEFALDGGASTTDVVPFGGLVCRYVRLAIRENGGGDVFPVGATTITGGHVGSAEVEFEAYESP